MSCNKINSPKRLLKETEQNYSISLIKPFNLQYFIESMVLLDSLYIYDVVCYRIKDIDKKKLIVGFHSKTLSYYDKQILIDLLNTSEEDLLNEIEEKLMKKKKKCRLNEENLLKNDKISSHWTNSRVMVDLMMNNDYYFIVYHKLAKSKKEWIDYSLEEYNYNSSSSEFSLNDCHFGDVGIEYLSFNISKLTNIKKLELKSNEIKDSGLKILSNSFILTPELTDLELNENYITQNGMIYLCDNLKYIKFLKKLDLSNNMIGDNGFEMFCENIHYITDLKVLHVNNNYITDDGMKIFCIYCSKLVNIKDLSFNNNKITDDCCDIIAKSICKCSKLNKLLLIDNYFENDLEFQSAVIYNHPNPELDVEI